MPESATLMHSESGSHPRPAGLARGFLAAVRWYQRSISPNTPPACRFTPTCSEYMAQAILRFGAWRGLWLGLKRIARCHPWTPGGYDPVPETDPRKETNATSHDQHEA